MPSLWAHAEGSWFFKLRSGCQYFSESETTTVLLAWPLATRMTLPEGREAGQALSQLADRWVSVDSLVSDVFWQLWSSGFLDALLRLQGSEIVVRTLTPPPHEGGPQLEPLPVALTRYTRLRGLLDL